MRGVLRPNFVGIHFRVPPGIFEGRDFHNNRAAIFFAAQQKAAALARICLGGVLLDMLDVLLSNLKGHRLVIRAARVSKRAIFAATSSLASPVCFAGLVFHRPAPSWSRL